MIKKTINTTNYKQKKISAIVPCYNYGCFLEEALTSLIKQTKKPTEIIIANDCSSDNTEKISKIFVKKFPNLISYYKNKTNLGIIKNFNKAVNITKYDYICFLGADNRFKKTYLEKASKILDQNKKIGIVYTDFELFGPRAKDIYNGFNPKYQGKINKKNKTYEINFPEFSEKTKKIQKTQNFIHGSSMYRKNAFKQVGGYLKKNLIPEDQNLFTRIINDGWKAKRLPEPLLEYRQHSENQANIKLQKKIFLKNLIKEKEKLQSDLDKIQSSKTYKLWQKYNDFKKYLFKE
jgi:GT2 family glycosyltransferase